MKIKSQLLLDELAKITRENLNYVQHLKTLSFEKLNARLSQDSWSALECIEHLNRYGDFYVPEIKNRIFASRSKSETDFKSGLLGNYFAQMMLPNDKLKKMKTFKSMNPIYSKIDQKVIDVFIAQQNQLLELLKAAQNISLNKTKTAISISKLIKLKLGDTFRFVIYHNQRHILQAKKVIETI